MSHHIASSANHEETYPSDLYIKVQSDAVQFQQYMAGLSDEDVIILKLICVEFQQSVGIVWFCNVDTTQASEPPQSFVCQSELFVAYEGTE
jgi:hypothetical protein